MKTCFAEVIVDISRADLDRTFSYRIPEALADRICPGAVVKVPFGARTILGCVVAVSETPTLDAARLRDILEVITDDTVVESSLVALAVWMKDHNGGTLNQALRTVMPRRRKVRDRLEKTVVLTASPEAVGAFIEHEGSGRAKAQARALAILKETAVMPVPELIREAGIAGPEPLLRLEEKGFLRIETGRSLRRVTEAVETEVVPEIEAAEEAVAREEAEDAEPVAQKEAVEPEHGVRNLLRGMTMNDKYLYIREVFGGDEDDFTQTMSVIGDLPDYDIAYDYLVNDLLLNPDEPAVAQLLEYLNKEM